MSISINPISDQFAAEIAGIDLARPLDDTEVAAIWQASDTYAVLVFRNQSLSDAGLHDFAARFGPLELPGARLKSLPTSQWGRPIRRSP